MDDQAKSHRGFLERARAAYAELKDKLRTIGGNPKIITCGHSLGAAISQLVHIMLHEDFEEELVNITFATPLTSNFPMAEKLGVRERDPARTMHHFVLHKDIVPAALFTDHIYNNLPWFASEDTIDFLLTVAWQGYERVEGMVEELLEKVEEHTKPENQTRDKCYAPLGQYYYIRDVGPCEVFKLPLGDPQYVAHALKWALVNALDVLETEDRFEYYFKKVVGFMGIELESDVEKKAEIVKKAHKIDTYEAKLKGWFAQHEDLADE